MTKRGTGAAIYNFLPTFSLANHCRRYNADGQWRDNLIGDSIAGVILAITLLPLGLAYASLAGLPPVYGLYCSMACLLLYPVFGTSNFTIVGPTAVTGILIGSTIPRLVQAGDDTDERRIEIATTMSFLMGAMLLLLGLFHAGYIANFLSRPVLKGFTSGAAITIACSQLPKMLGYHVERSEYVYIRLYWLFQGIEKTNWQTLLLGIENLLLFYSLKYFKTRAAKFSCTKRNAACALIVKTLPVALLLVIVNVLLVYFAKLHEHGVAIVGSIPSGYPAPRNVFTSNFLSDTPVVLPSTIIIALVSFMATVSVGKTMALKYGGQVDGTQEMVALGFANLIGAFFNAFPASGSFSSTAVNAEGGARTAFTGLIASMMLLIIVLFITPAFYYLPQVTLACLVITAVLNLIDFRTARKLWLIDRTDCFMFCVALLATLGLGIEIGLLVGMGVSILRIIKQAALPHKAVLGRTEDGAWRNVNRFDTQQVPGLRVVRVDANLTFVNASFFKEFVLKAAAPADITNLESMPPYIIVVDCSCMGSIDSSGIDAIEELPGLLATAAGHWRSKRIGHFKKRLAKAQRQQANDVSLAHLKALVATAKAQVWTAPQLFYTALRGAVRDRLTTYRRLKESNEFEQAPKACSCCKKRAVVGEKDDPTGVFVEPLTTDTEETPDIDATDVSLLDVAKAVTYLSHHMPSESELTEATGLEEKPSAAELSPSPLKIN